MLKLILFQLQFQSFRSCLEINKTEYRTILREIITSVVIKKYRYKHNTLINILCNKQSSLVRRT